MNIHVEQGKFSTAAYVAVHQDRTGKFWYGYGRTEHEARSDLQKAMEDQPVFDWISDKQKV